MQQKISFLLVLLLCHSALLLKAQRKDVVHYTVDDGLPSNHIYSMTRDHLGYLWLATPKGVARFNGYSFTVFTTRDGLPKNDVWHLVEDSAGRMWLSTISTEIGYIYNNIYHKCNLKGISGTIYPQSTTNYNNGIIFYSPYISPSSHPAICVSENDSVIKYELQDSINGRFFISDLKNIYLFNNEVFTRCKLQRNGITIKDTAFQAQQRHSNFIYNLPSIHLGDLFFVYEKQDTSVYIIDLLQKKEFKISVCFDSIGSYMGFYRNSNSVNIIGSKYFLSFSLHQNRFGYNGYVKRSINLDGIKNISTFIDDSVWGECIGTSNNGLFILGKRSLDAEQEKEYDLEEYKNIGYSSEHTFWWNNTTTTLLKISKHNKEQVLNIKNYADKIVGTFNDTTLFFHNQFGSYSLLYKINYKSDAKNPFLFTGMSTLPLQNNIFYAIGARGLYRFSYLNDTPKIDGLDNQRYIDILYDSATNAILAYTSNNLVVISRDGMIKTTPISKLTNNAGALFERILIEPTNHQIFVKTKDDLFILTEKHTRLQHVELNGFNLDECSICISNNKLILANGFAVIYIQITDNGSLSNAYVTYNYKSAHFHSINELQLCNDALLLNTDKGVYWIKTPSDSMFAQKSAVNYPVMVSFFGTNSCRFTDNDTLTVSQTDRDIHFDLINTDGCGRVTYEVRNNDGKWINLTANELNLAPYEPGKYYDLYLVARDNVWKSKIVHVHLYVIPLWYQTSDFIQIIWIGGCLMVLIVIGTAVLVTRKLVINANRKRNLRMELELKSVYAQINPHFIFNSLNSALLMVSKNKMDEAYEHIFKFSRLLRNYLKSSRNRFITLKDEISNLKGYVELQQVRFKNCFEVEIFVAPSIDAASIQIPSLLLQPFVENAINHGLLPKDEMGKLSLHFEENKEKKTLFCTITDNGIGRKRSKLIRSEVSNTQDESYGDLLVKDLVKIFNSYEKIKIDIQYVDIPLPESGTTVNIKITYT